jgi:hypothetical protein
MNRPAFESQFRQLNRLSQTAGAQHDESSIRAFTDSVVDAFVPAGPASNALKDRLFALERQQDGSAHAASSKPAAGRFEATERAFQRRPVHPRTRRLGSRVP